MMKNSFYRRRNVKKILTVFLVLTLFVSSSFTSCIPIFDQDSSNPSDDQSQDTPKDEEKPDTPEQEPSETPEDKDPPKNPEEEEPSDTPEDNPTASYSENLEYELNDDGESYTVVGFGELEGTELIIPGEHNGLPVTAIGEMAFADEYYLRPLPPSFDEYLNQKHTVLITKAVIPDSVKSIGSFAFFNCVFLETVVLPDSVTTIGDAAFAACIILNNVNLPSSVQSIGAGCFSACRSLVDINLSETLASVGEGAFIGCTSLEKIDVSENNPNYSSISNNLYSKDGKQLIHYAAGQKEDTFTVPSTVESIAPYAFGFCDNLKQVNLSSSMTCIGANTFDNCYSLSVVNIPTSVERIEECAFHECYSLITITIPESVTYVSERAFLRCYSLMEIYNRSSEDVCAEFPCHVITDPTESCIKNVGDYVFYDNGTDVYLVKYLGNETEITLPKYGDSIPYTIYSYAFYDTVRETYKPFIYQAMAGGHTTITSVTIPDYVTGIGECAFGGCILLKSVIIPKSVTKMGAYVFNGCNSIKVYCEAKTAPVDWNMYWNFVSTHKSVCAYTIWGYVK